MDPSLTGLAGRRLTDGPRTRTVGKSTLLAAPLDRLWTRQEPAVAAL